MASSDAAIDPEAGHTTSFSRSAVQSVPLAEVQYTKRQGRMDKFRLLMWKNWTIKRRRPFATLVELCLPLFLFFILVLVRQRRLPEEHDATAFSPECMLSNGMSCVKTFGNTSFVLPTSRRSLPLNDADWTEEDALHAFANVLEAISPTDWAAHDAEAVSHSPNAATPTTRAFTGSDNGDSDSDQPWHAAFAQRLVQSRLAERGITLEQTPRPAQGERSRRRISVIDLILSKRVLYSPKGGDTDILIKYVKDDIMRSFNNLLPPYLLDQIFVGYDTEEQIVNRAVGFSDIVCGLGLRGMNTSIPGHPVMPRTPGNNFKFVVRVQPEQTRNTQYIYSFRSQPSTDPTYYFLGFLFFQDYMERAIIRHLTGQQLPATNVYTHHYAFPPFTTDGFAGAIATTFPLLMTLSFVYSVSMLVKSIVYEKEQRLKEIMKMMGLSTSVYWASWYMTSLIMMTISVIAVVITVFAGSVLAHSDASLTFIFIMCFIFSTISLTFLISVFFSRARLAAACAGIIYFMTYLPYVLVQRNAGILSRSVKFVSCLCSTTAFGLGATYLADYERRGEGITWDTFDVVEYNDNFTFRDAMIMMVVDAVLYLVLAWYIEGVAPGKYGVPRPWNFPFTASYWRGGIPTQGTPMAQQRSRLSTLFSDLLRRSRSSVGFAAQQNLDAADDSASMSDFDGATTRTTAELNGLASEDCEVEPKGVPAGVDIRHLRKVYENGKVAVHNLSLRMYEDHITALLGHNGAGKTTTMSILTGLFPPTSGTALVNNYDIRTQIDGVRRSLGICPQYNVLFDFLTVRDHMEFYSSLKGVEKSYIKADVDAMLKSVGLEDKEHALAGTLSGGMKRKLSVAIAFIGGSKTVILDEPTAGVDPYARRAIWDLLIRHKAGRTIILSTHHMEEADLLADRIAIIADGRLRCIGASLFLKRRFGIGYHMTLVKRSDATSEPAVSAFLRSFVPAAKLTGDIGAELSYILPGGQSHHFPALFTALEQRLGELGISSYGVGVTTLEEVFLRVGDLHDESEQQQEEKARQLNGGSDGPALPAVASGDSFGGHVNGHGNGNNSNNGTYAKRAASSTRRLELVLDEAGDGAADDLGDGDLGTGPAVGGGSSARPSNAFAIELDGMGNGNSTVAARPISSYVTEPEQYHQPPKQQHQHQQHHPHQFGEQNQKGGMRLARDLDQEIDMASINHVVVSGIALRLQQMVAMLIKRVHHARRDQKAVASQLFVPAAFICIAMAIALIYPPPTDYPALAMDTRMLDIGNLMFYGSYSGNTSNSVEPYASNLFRHLVQVRNPRDRYQNMTEQDLQGYVLAHHYVMQRSSFAGFTLDNKVPISGMPIANTTLWYRGENRHGQPVVTNVYHNALLAMMLGADGAQTITCINQAWPTTAKDKANEYRKQGTDLVVGIFIIIAFSFVPASFVLYIVSERQSKAKHMQFVSGVNSASYWVATFVWDLFTFMFPILVALIIFVAFDDEAYSGANFTAVAILFLLYAWSMTPLMYCLSYLFEVPPTAYVTLICANLITGITSVVATFMLDLFPNDPDLLEINQVLKKVFLILPNYCMGRGIMDLAINQFINQYLAAIGQSRFADPLTFDVVGYNIVWMAIEGGLFFAMVLGIERLSVSPVVHRLLARYEEEKYRLGLSLRQRFGRARGVGYVPANGDASAAPSAGNANGTSAGGSIRPPKSKHGHALLNIVDEEEDDDDDDDDSALPQYVRDLNAKQRRSSTLPGTTSVELQSVPSSSSEGAAARHGNAGMTNGIVETDPEGIAMIVEDDDVIAERQRVLRLPIERYTLEDRARDQARVRAAVKRAQRAAKRNGDIGRNGSSGSSVASVQLPQRDIIIVKELGKTFRQGDQVKVAVNHLSVGIRTGECFGLLGVNGAGKTTTFRMLTGDCSPTIGDAFLDGYSIHREQIDVRQRIGYCPQFDALNELLTARELLFMYARLRGLLEPHIPRVVDWCIRKLQLDKYADRPCGTYSGGNKRKLSTAIALIGNPAVIFMDEPTTGMDPKARRFLWDVISSLMMNGRCIVFTSHSMEECEALCTRMAIMVNGTFRCMGSSQHLKSRYGVGYTLIVKLRDGAQDKLPRLKQYVTECFPDARLKEEHSNLVQYQLPSAMSSAAPEAGTAALSPSSSGPAPASSDTPPRPSISLATIFSRMEEARASLDIEDYSVNQTTLEQVFVGFARFQQGGNQP